jgi:dTDP-4-amino-4,6-dideoxygalactose transaminase
VGTFGDFGCASLYANKLITAGDGRFIVSRLAEPKERLCSLRNHGFQQFAHFIHLESSGDYTINGLGAALAAMAVPHIDAILERRGRIAVRYRALLDGIEGLECVKAAQYGPDKPWLFGVILVEKCNRADARAKLAHAGIETRDFFFPLH